MPDPTEPTFDPEAVFAAGAAAIDHWLNELPGGALSALGPSDLDLYKPRGFTNGWRLAVPFSDAVRRLDILLPSAFPWKAPRFALVDRPAFLTLPHIEEDGILCLASDGMEIDSGAPLSVAQRLLGEACRMIERLLSGNFEDDFRAEFLSYWDHAANHKGIPVVSLIEAAPPTRVGQVWRGKSLYLIGDDRKAIEAWLVNRYGSVTPGFTTEDAPFVWLGEAMTPAQYPKNNGDLRGLMPNGAAWQLIGDAVAAEPDKFLVVLGMGTANGPALAGVLLTAAPASPHGARQPLTRGFRPDAIPQAILAARYLGGAKLVRTSIARADPAWIHGRGIDWRTSILRGATVVIVGCGSVGAPVAVALAQAGVSRLVLIDADILKWANLGRHPLGAADIDKPKAKALAERIRKDLPHVTVDCHVADLGTILRDYPEVFEGADLVVAATGSWAADSELDAWQTATGRHTPVVYGWTEAHACAGHAVLIREDGDLRSGFDSTGLPYLSVTTWPAGSQQQEPACGAVYQPYGPIELTYINAMISELALDALLQVRPLSTHRIWTASDERLARVGGEWSPDWVKIASKACAQFVERPWPPLSDAFLQVAAE